MKLKTRLVIAFFTIIIIPVLMAAMMVSMVCRYQIGVVEKNYGITGTTISDFTNSMQVLARVTEKPYHELKKMSEHASEMEDATELDQFNKKLENKNAYLLVRKDGTIVYTGSDDDRVKAVIEQLPGYGDTDTTSENGIYLGGDAEALVKQVDFRYDDGNKGSAFIVSDVSNVIPEVGQFFCEILIGIVVILILTSAVLIIWIYRAVMGPIGKMQTAAQNIKDGNLDFECLEALDVQQFNEDMTRLLNGEEVEMPSFNFKTGKREYRGNRLRLGEGDILVIEGIHGLNDRLSYMLPAESKFKIYISALTQLNIDEHNPLSTTDCRLLRRIVRDARTRGTTAQETLAMWPSVRRGEEKNIFPFQDSADVMFNSALLYEVAVLKVYAEPLLFQIPTDAPEHLEAKRLLKLLDYFLPLPTEGIMQSSLVREFVGGSCFNV